MWVMEAGLSMVLSEEMVLFEGDRPYLEVVATLVAVLEGVALSGAGALPARPACTRAWASSG